MRVSTVGDNVLTGADALPEHYQQPQGFYVLLSIDDPVDAKTHISRAGGKRCGAHADPEDLLVPCFGVLVDQFAIPWEISGEQARSAE
jgi:PhnB protein